MAGKVHLLWSADGKCKAIFEDICKKKKAECNIGHWSFAHIACKSTPRSDITDLEWRSHLATFSNPLIKVEPLMVFD